MDIEVFIGNWGFSLTLETDLAVEPSFDHSIVGEGLCYLAITIFVSSSTQREKMDWLILASPMTWGIFLEG